MSREACCSQAAEAFCAGLTDQDLADLVQSALDADPKLNRHGRAFLAAKNPRQSGLVKRMVYERYGKAPKPGRNMDVQVAADFLED